MSLEDVKLILGSDCFEQCMKAPLWELNEFATQACLGGAEKEMEAIDAIITHRTERCRERQ